MSRQDAPPHMQRDTHTSRGSALPETYVFPPVHAASQHLPYPPTERAADVEYPRLSRAVKRGHTSQPQRQATGWTSHGRCAGSQVVGPKKPPPTGRTPPRPDNHVVFARSPTGGEAPGGACVPTPCAADTAAGTHSRYTVLPPSFPSSASSSEKTKPHINTRTVHTTVSADTGDGQRGVCGGAEECPKRIYTWNKGTASVRGDTRYVLPGGRASPPPTSQRCA